MRTDITMPDWRHVSLKPDHPDKDALRQKFLNGWVADFTGSDIATRFPRYVP